MKLTALKKDYRPAIVLDDVHNGAFTKIKVVEPSAGKKEKIHAYKSTKIKKIEREIRETHKRGGNAKCAYPPAFYVAEQTILPLPSSEQDKKEKTV